MERQHVITLAAAIALLTGCSNPGAPTATLKVSPTQAARQHVAVQAPAPALKVVKQHASLTIQAPAAEAQGTGAITMEFVFPNRGYALKATAADVAKITVALKTRSFLLTKTVANAEVTQAQMLNGRAAVNFTGLKAGSYWLDIAALDAAGATLGATTTASAEVIDGQTTPVDAQIKLTADAASTPAGGTGIGVNLEIVNG